KFPHLLGLVNGDDLTLHTDDDRSTWRMPILEVLELRNSSLIQGASVVSATLSKVGRKGNTLGLSGSEVYNGIVLPLLKAHRHFEAVTRPPATAGYFDCYATIPMCLVDAPMVAVDVGSGGPAIDRVSLV